MSNQLTVRSLPDAEAGLSFTVRTASWNFTPWQVVADYLPSDHYVLGITFQYGFALAAVDTTYEQIFEVGVGKVSDPVTKIQIPTSVRFDTAVGYYFPPRVQFSLPEPFFIPEGSTVCMRMTGTLQFSTDTYNGVKLLCQATKATEGLNSKLRLNNYQHVSSGSGMSVTEKNR